jgi:hypothetical protein
MAYKYDSLRTASITTGAGVDSVMNSDSDIFFSSNGSGNIPFNSAGGALVSTSNSVVGAINEMELTTDTYFVSTTAELNAAFTAIGTSGNLSLINLAPTDFILDTSETLEGVVIRGSGRGTRLLFDQVGGPFTWTLNGNVHISNLRMESGNSILTINNTSRNEISNCTIDTTGGICITVASGDNLFKISDCNFGGLTFATHGIFEDKTTFGRLECRNCRFLNFTTAGIEISGSKVANISNCSFDGCGLRFLTPDGTLGVASTLVEGCTFDNSTIAVEFDTAGRVYRNKNITGCSFEANETHISNDSVNTECKVFGNVFTTKGSTADFTNTGASARLNIQGNEYFLSIADGTTTLSGLESYVDCVNSAVGITVNLPALPRASAGNTIVINKANGTSTVTIGGSVNDFPDLTWSTSGEYTTVEWNGAKWVDVRVPVGPSFQQYAIYDMAADVSVANTGSTLLNNWDFQEGNSVWDMTGGIFTPGVEGVYGVALVISWAANNDGQRTVEILKNNAITFRVITRLSPDTDSTMFAEQSGVFYLDSDDNLRVSAVKVVLEPLMSLMVIIQLFGEFGEYVNHQQKAIS